MNFAPSVTQPRTQVCTFNEALNYQNDSIVYKFMEYYDVSFEEASDLFEETKKWMWLCAVAIEEHRQGQQPPQLTIDESMMFLDEMWHTFILFTREYHWYCMEKFGFFIHHVPTTKEEKERSARKWADDPEGAQAEREEQLRAQYSYIYDKLGEETLVKWYGEWPEKYTPEYIKSISRRF